MSRLQNTISFIMSVQILITGVRLQSHVDVNTSIVAVPNFGEKSAPEYPTVTSKDRKINVEHCSKLKPVHFLFSFLSHLTYLLSYPKSRY